MRQPYHLDLGRRDLVHRHDRQSRRVRERRQGPHQDHLTNRHRDRLGHQDHQERHRVDLGRPYRHVVGRRDARRREPPDARWGEPVEPWACCRDWGEALRERRRALQGPHRLRRELTDPCRCWCRRGYCPVAEHWAAGPRFR
jgi:hypothetical protein